MVVEHHAGSGAGKLPKASGDHMFGIENKWWRRWRGGDMKETISCVPNQRAIQQKPQACQSDSSIDSTLVDTLNRGE